MDMYIIALIMGLVEGLTEFLPVSSSGHLILTGALLGFEGEKAASFSVVIQAGAILAVLLLYFQTFWGLLFPPKNQGNEKKFSGINGIFLLFLTSLPAGLSGLFFHSAIKSLFTPESVLIFLVLGSLCMLGVEHYKSRNKIQEKISSLDSLTPKVALGIGFFQCLSLCPGFSRSAASIMGGMVLGTSRKVAAEYSFLAAVPLILAAAGYDFIMSFPLFTSADIPFFLVGTFASFVFACIAIKAFISLVSKFTLKPFAYYRIALAIVLGIYFYM